MRKLLIAALLLVGCSDSIAGPPSGLPVTLREAVGDATHIPAVVAQGDSLVGRFPVAAGCALASAKAGWWAGRVVITVTDSMTANPCPLALVAYDHVAIVKPAPAGSYDVDVVSRVVDLDRRATTHVVASAVVTFP